MPNFHLSLSLFLRPGPSDRVQLERDRELGDQRRANVLPVRVQEAAEEAASGEGAHTVLRVYVRQFRAHLRGETKSGDTRVDDEQPALIRRFQLCHKRSIRCTILVEPFFSRTTILV